MIGALNVKCVSRYLYLFRSLLRTLILCIQRSFWQVLASAVPFLLPNPLCLPFLLASLLALTRDLEWTATGFLITSPSLISFLMLARELALAISLISLGSSHTWELMIVNFQQTNNKSALYSATVIKDLCWTPGDSSRGGATAAISNIKTNPSFFYFFSALLSLMTLTVFQGLKFYHHKRYILLIFNVIFYLLLSTFHNISREAFLEL